MNDAADPGLSDAQLLRYSRHILLDEFGVEAQMRLLGAHALVIGAGGLGSPVALYLGSAGVGTLTIVDDDVVDLTNLQRQIVHAVDRLGEPKVQSAATAVANLNPDARVVALRTREADLDKHLQSGQGAEQKDEAREKAREEARKKLEADFAARNGQPKPPIEFGSAEDFQLAQALNRLKGKTVLVSKTAVERKAEATTN